MNIIPATSRRVMLRGQVIFLLFDIFWLSAIL
jgi:hypothetical protein